MDSPKYALLLEQLGLAADTHDGITFDALFVRTRQAYEAYNSQRVERGWQPLVIHESSWNKLWEKAHRFVWN